MSRELSLHWGYLHKKS